MKSVFDIAVVGAGATGLAAALAFARAGFTTCLVGALDVHRDGRTVALLDGSVRFLRALEVWASIEADSAPMTAMRLIDDTDSLFRPPPATFHAAEIGLDAFGWNVENATLVERLAAAAAGAANLRLIPKRAANASFNEEVGRISLSDHSTVEARLVVAADGRNSLLREAGGIRTRRWTYPQSALVTLLTHERAHGDASTEFHTRHGPFTLVPLPGRRSSLVWVTSPAEAARLGALGNEDLAAAVERQAHSLLGKMQVEGPRAVVPMTGLSVERYFADRLALVGEAAHVFPPIGAQGLNLGFRDVASLYDAVVDARAAGEDIGHAITLRQYQRSRDLDVRLRTAAVDGLNRTLLAGVLSVDFLRGAGLIALSLIGPLRRVVMREGLQPSLGSPRLMRAEAP